MNACSRRIALVRVPRGLPAADDFELVEDELAEPGAGELLVRNAFCSVDPFMRLMMSTVRGVGDRPPFRPGAPLTGGAVGVVEASGSAAFRAGDWVVHQEGWRDLSLVREDGDALRRVDPDLAPPSTALGVLGMPGLTAWCGMLGFGRPQPGETVYVSSAAGAVGSLAAQLAARAGARVLASAGAPEKRAWLERLGFEVFDYRARPVEESLRRLAPDGVDLYFDNVGGRHLEAAIEAMAFRGRIVACGAVSLYNDEQREPGPANLDLLFTKELTIQGVRSRAHRDSYPEFLADVGPQVADGTIRYEETVVRGLEQAPAAFVALFAGANLGKMLVVP